MKCFDFFRFRVTAVSSGAKEFHQTPRGFWNCTLLQAAHVEPAVWHAVAALGALYRKWEVVSQSSAGPWTSVTNVDATVAAVSDGTSDAGLGLGGVNDRVEMDTNLQSLRLADQASTCYTRSMSLARSISNPGSMLVLSLALAATANLTGKWVESSVHVQAGQKLMKQMTSKSRGRPVTETEVNAAESLARLNLQWASFSDERARYPFAENQEEAGAGIDTDRDQSTHSLGLLEENGSSGLQQANMALVRIVQRILTQAGLQGMQNTPVDVPDMGSPNIFCASPMEVERAIVQDLENWERDLTRLLSRTAPTTHQGPGSCLDLLGIKLMHTAARLLLAAGVMRPSYHELIWDDCLAYFERLLALVVLILRKEAEGSNPLFAPAAAAVVLSLDDFSINMVLWLTTMRCRHPVLRRRALAVLQGCRRVEGVWMSTSAGAAAARLVEVEEGSVDLPATVAKVFCQRQRRRRRHRHRGDRDGDGDGDGDWDWEGGSVALEKETIRDIEAEKDGDPGSWLGPDVAWMVPRSGWPGDMSGASVVPLQRRVAQVEVRAEYDPRVGKSMADLDLTFAERGVDGALRKQTVSINF